MTGRGAVCIAWVALACAPGVRIGTQPAADAGSLTDTCQLQCGADCVAAPETDHFHCGSCNNECPASGWCEAGACRCPGAQSVCGMECVSTQDDAAHCGRCDQQCPLGAGCAHGECACPGTTAPCNGSCLNLSADVENCGACGRRCPAEAPCVAGVCQCPGGRAACGTACADLQTDTARCGACETACPPMATCSDGICLCPDNLTACPEACVDLTSDLRACGACGHPCASGATCSEGECHCPPGRTACNGACVDLSSDPNNCGTCQTTCTECYAGRCIELLAELPQANAVMTLQVDDEALYWLTTGDTMNQNAELVRFPLAGRVPTTLASGQTSFVTNCNSYFVPAMSIDRDSVYWIRHDPDPFASNHYGSVMKVNKRGGEFTALASLIEHPCAIALAPNDVYVAGYRLQAVPKNGGILRTFAPRADTVAIAGETMFWTIGYGPSYLMKTDLRTETSERLMNTTSSYTLTDGLGAFWRHDLDIYCLPDIATSPFSYYSGRTDDAFAVDETSIYSWSGVVRPQGLVKAPKDSMGHSELLLPVPGGITAYAVDATSIYWGTSSESEGARVYRMTPK